MSLVEKWIRLIGKDARGIGSLQGILFCMFFFFAFDEIAVSVHDFPLGYSLCQLLAELCPLPLLFLTPLGAALTTSVFLPSISTMLFLWPKNSSDNIVDDFVRKVYVVCCSCEPWVMLVSTPCLQIWRCQRVSETCLPLLSKDASVSQERKLCESP